MTKTVAVFAVLLAGLFGCGGAPPPSAASAKTPQEQASIGGQVFASECAGCHGSKGEGSSAPRLVGAGALPADPPPGSSRKVRFQTALDVFQYVQANMPPGKAGSLTEDQAWAILAFDLQQNGIHLDAKLDARSAAGVTLPH